MPKIILTQGLPASGKSTWAKQLVKDNPLFVRFSKDDIREEQPSFKHGQPYNKDFENKVLDIERERVEDAMKLGINIVVDNTHLIYKKTKHNPHIDFYRSLAEKYGYDFEIKQFNVSVDECRRRNKERTPSVPDEVYDRMLKENKIPSEMPDNPTYIPYNSNLQDCIILDIDGTLAHMNGKRTPYEYDKVHLDDLNAHLLNVIDKLTYYGNDEELDIIIVSGRKDECKKETEEWLYRHGIRYKELYMRASADTREDSLVKQDIYDEHIKGKYNVLAVFDDRNRVVDMWRRNGLLTLQVWYGNF